MAATRLTEGRRSIASIAVEYARQIFESFSEKTVLSIGAGKMSTLVLQHFSELKVKRLMVCNRDINKAELLARQFHGQSVPMDQLMDHLAEADIVISSTASPAPIITATMFQQVMKQRRWRPVFLVDIAIPRDIDEAVGELENVYLYNIDDLQEVAAATDSNRKDAVDAARILVAKQVEDFVSWHTAREVGPLIEQLFSRSHGMAKEEVQRTLNKLPEMTPEQRQHVEELARRIVNKLLNDPVQAVRESGTESSPFVRAMAKLFRLG
jgi:glutamyl-tRNA reductase